MYFVAGSGPQPLTEGVHQRVLVGPRLAPEV